MSIAGHDTEWVAVARILRLAMVGMVLARAVADASGRLVAVAGEATALALTGGAGTPVTDGWLTIIHPGNAGMCRQDSVEVDELHHPMHVVRRHLVGLKMPRALETLQDTLTRIERGELSTLEAIEEIFVLAATNHPGLDLAGLRRGLLGFIGRLEYAGHALLHCPRARRIGCRGLRVGYHGEDAHARLLRRKLEHSPVLRAAIAAGNWHVLRMDALDRFAARPDPVPTPVQRGRVRTRVPARRPGLRRGVLLLVVALAVRDDARQPSAGVHDRGHSHAFGAHLLHGLFHGRGFRHRRHRVA